MSRFKKRLVLPCIIIIVSLYLIGVNVLKRVDRVDDIRDSVPASATVAEGGHEERKTEAEEDEELAAITDKININTAVESELTTLHGIGVKLARRIIDMRERIGGFVSIEQLKDVEGIGEKLFNSIKDYITVE